MLCAEFISPSVGNSRWVATSIEVGEELLEDLKVVALYKYTSPGLLTGESVSAVFFEDHRHFETTRVVDHLVQVSARIDMLGTYPDQRFGSPSAWGICYIVNDICAEFELLT